MGFKKCVTKTYYAVPFSRIKIALEHIYPISLVIFTLKQKWNNRANRISYKKLCAFQY